MSTGKKKLSEPQLPFADHPESYGQRCFENNFLPAFDYGEIIPLSRQLLTLFKPPAACSRTDARCSCAKK